ncbi:MAG: ATP-binding protein, partial [Planctomycetota bacterium]
GPIGIGKSRLLDWLIAESKRRGYPVLQVRTIPHQSLLANLARQASALVPSSDAAPVPDSSRRRLLQLLDDRAEPLESKNQLLWGVTEVLASATTRGPACFVLDDLHEASEEEAIFLAQLVGRLRGLPILAVGAFRESEQSAQAPGIASFADESVFEPLEVGPMEPMEVLRLISRPDQLVEPRVAHRILSLAEGSPLVAIESFRFLRDVGAIEESSRAISPGPHWGEHPLPERLYQMITARMRALPDEWRTTLEFAAVVGRQFDPSLVAELLGTPLLHVLRILQSLYRESRIVRPDGDDFEFAHAILHEVVYSDLAPRLRKEAHRSIAQRMEQRAESDSAALGRHWLQAGDVARARPHLVRAATQASRRQELHRSLSLYEQAKVDSSAIDPQMTKLLGRELMAVAIVYSQQGQPEVAWEMLDALTANMDAAASPEFAAQLVATRSHLIYYQRGANEVDREALRKATREITAPGVRARAYYVLGLIAKIKRELPEANAHFRAALRDFRSANKIAGASDAMDQLGTVAKHRGQLDRAARLYGYAATLSRQVGRRSNAAASEFNRALIAFEKGKLGGLRRTLQNSIEVLQVEGSVHLAAHARIILAVVQLAEGDGAAAADSLEVADEALRRDRYLPALLSQRTLATELEILRGTPKNARRLLAETREIAEGMSAMRKLHTLAALEVVALAVDDHESSADQLARELIANPVYSEDTVLATELLLRLGQAAWIGANARRWRSVRAIRRHARRHVRAFLAEARLLREARLTPTRTRILLAQLRREDYADQRAFLTAASFLLEAAGSTTESTRHALTAEARRIADRIGCAWLELGDAP